MKRFLPLVLLVVFVAAAGAAPAATEKDWTFMVFLNADNNLDEFGVKDQDEMAKVGSNDHLNIVSLIDRFEGPASLNYIEKGRVTTLEDLGEVDMGDYRLLVEFATKTMQRYPAKHYALVIWNHGSGWNKKHRVFTSRGISYDDSSNNHITTAQLGMAVDEIGRNRGRKLDLLCMDACLMQMIEVAWQVRQGCDFVVASEETEPGDGYPYDTALAALRPAMAPRAFAAEIVKAFTASYQHETPDDGDWTHGPRARAKRTTQSVVETAQLPALKDALDAWCSILVAGDFTKELQQAAGNVERFAYWSNCDLPHLVRLLAASIPDARFQAATKALRVALDAAIIANGATGASNVGPGDDYGGGDDPDAGRYPIDAYGLAIYFPEKAGSFAANYGELAWAKDSRWDEMLFDFYHRAQVAPIVTDVARGQLASLRAWVETANAGNRSLSRRLATQLRFLLYTENSVVPACRGELRDLLTRLQAR